MRSGLHSMMLVRTFCLEDGIDPFLTRPSWILVEEPGLRSSQRWCRWVSSSCGFGDREEHKRPSARLPIVPTRKVQPVQEQGCRCCRLRPSGWYDWYCQLSRWTKCQDRKLPLASMVSKTSSKRAPANPCEGHRSIRYFDLSSRGYSAPGVRAWLFVRHIDPAVGRQRHQPERTCRAYGRSLSIASVRATSKWYFTWK